MPPLSDRAGVQDCAVLGLEPGELRVFARDHIGAVKAPKQVEVWDDLPRSKIGKVLKPDVRARLLLTGSRSRPAP